MRLYLRRTAQCLRSSLFSESGTAGIVRSILILYPHFIKVETVAVNVYILLPRRQEHRHCWFVRHKPIPGLLDLVPSGIPDRVADAHVPSPILDPRENGTLSHLPRLARGDGRGDFLIGKGHRLAHCYFPSHNILPSSFSGVMVSVKSLSYSVNAIFIFPFHLPCVKETAPLIINHPFSE